LCTAYSAAAFAKRFPGIGRKFTENAYSALERSLL
jgi:hypothetical protein